MPDVCSSILNTPCISIFSKKSFKLLKPSAFARVFYTKLKLRCIYNGRMISSFENWTQFVRGGRDGKSCTLFYRNKSEIPRKYLCLKWQFSLYRKPASLVIQTSKDDEFSEFYQLAKNWGAGIKSQAQTL